MSTNLDLIESQTATKGVLILSHSRARSFRPSKFGVADDCSMIRVEDPEAEFKALVFEKEFKEVFQYKFDDADTQYNKVFGWMSLMTREQAESIVNAFEIIKDRKLVVIHCYAGVSRSSAIACAFCQFIGDLETENLIRTCKKYVPNSHVFSLLMQVINERNGNVQRS